MVEIEFSLIADSPNGADILSHLLKEYEARHGVHVWLRTMTWEKAWSHLLQFALYGKGPDVSHVGSTWSDSLVMMNALRPFTPHEVKVLGGPDAFIAPAWQSATLAGDKQVWAMPWLADTYVVCYWRDLLTRAGIDEQTAFGTAEAMAETCCRLQSAGVEIPWMPAFDLVPDILHVAASWVWGAGGHFVNDEGTRTRFNEPEAIAGLEAYFELYHYLSPMTRQLSTQQRLDLFTQRRTVVTIAPSETTLGIMRGQVERQVREHLGITVPPGVPWIGGDNLVIWRYTQGYSDRERAAVELVSFLASQPAQVSYCRTTGFLPARFDALSETIFEPRSVARIIDRAFRTGRPYKAVGMWTSIENQLSQTLDQVAVEVMADPAADINTILHEHLDPLARRLDLMLSH